MRLTRRPPPTAAERAGYVATSEQWLREAGLPNRIATILFYAGYWRVAEVEGAPDEDLLHTYGIGPRRLAAIRAVLPYRAGADVVDPKNVTYYVASINVWEDPPVVRTWWERPS